MVVKVVSLKVFDMDKLANNVDDLLVSGARLGRGDVGGMELLRASVCT